MRTKPVDTTVKEMTKRGILYVSHSLSQNHRFFKFGVGPLEGI